MQFNLVKRSHLDPCMKHRLIFPTGEPGSMYLRLLIPYLTIWSFGKTVVFL